MQKKSASVSTLSILIPFFNEGKTLSAILSRVTRQKLKGWKKEIILIDDGSTDNSLSQIRPYLKSVTLLRHKKNLGKGAAVSTGITNAHGSFILIQDADLEYDPNDWGLLLMPFSQLGVSAVYGSRNLLDRRERGYLLYYLGGILISKFTNILYGSQLTDICTGYKAFRKESLEDIKLSLPGFEFDVEITTKLLKKARKIVEVPIHYQPRLFKDGKKISGFVGLLDIMTIIKERFSP